MRWTILRLYPVAVASLFLFLFATVQLSSAVIYTWKDDKGGRHFTDDLSSVPLEYRSKTAVEIVKGTESPASEELEEKSVSERNSDKSEKPNKLSKKQLDKKAEELKKLEALKLDIESTRTYLNSEIKRDENLVTFLPSMVNAKFMIPPIKELLPSKIALAERLAKSTSPTLKSTADFLKSSAELDEQERVSDDQGMLTRARQLIDRLKTEMVAEQQIVTQLTDELEKIDSVIKAGKPLFPVYEAPKMEAVEEPGKSKLSAKKSSEPDDVDNDFPAEDDNPEESDVPKKSGAKGRAVSPIL